MILNAYSIYDRKALAYHSPFYQTTDGAAVRTFSDLVQDNNTQVGRHPADFVLYCVGSYDDAKGELTPLAPLRHVIDATALVRHQADLFSDRPGVTPPELGQDGPVAVPLDFATRAKGR